MTLPDARSAEFDEISGGGNCGGGGGGGGGRKGSRNRRGSLGIGATSGIDGNND
jgi:hypothetical protein